MNAEPSTELFQMEHQPRRPDYARRYLAWNAHSQMASFTEFEDTTTGEVHSLIFYSYMWYRFSDGSEAQVVPSAAWCFECQRLVAAEHLDSRDEIEKTRMKLESIISGSKEFINDFFWPTTPTTQNVLDRLEEREKYWKRFAERKSPERCLTCAGTNFIKIGRGIDDYIEIPNGPALRCVGYGMADVGLEPKMLFDPEGLRIAE